MKKIKSCILVSLCFTVFSCSKVENKETGFFSFASEKYTVLDSQKKQLRLDSLYANRSKTANDSLFRNFLFDLSAEYYYLNDNKKSFTVCKKILQLSKTANDTLSIAKAYSYIGDTYQISQKDSAYYYYHKSENVYRILNNRNQIGKMLFKKAYILFFEGNYAESEGLVSNALLYLKYGKDAEMLYSAYSLLGLNLEKLEEYENALKYQLLAKQVIKDVYGTNSNLEKKYIYNIESSINLSNIYEKTHQFDKSIQVLQAVLLPELKENWIQGYASVIGNLGYSKMKSGNIKGVEKLFFEALSISKQNGTDEEVIYKLLNLGEYYAIQKDSLRSTAYLKQSLALAEKLKMGDEIKKSLQLLSQIDPPNAAIYDARYITYSDSLAKAQRISRNKYARIEFETAVVEDENKALSKQNTAILIGSFFTILALVLVLVYRQIKNQKKEIKFRKAQQKAEDEIFELLKENQLKLSLTKELEQNRISKELHDSVMNRLYGARMQLGILNENDTREAKEKRLLYVDLLQEIEQEIRTISYDLRNDVLDNPFDFISLLTNLIQLQNEIGATLFSFESDDKIDWETIDSLVKITIYRIVQESLLNVTKHANAATCKVSVSLHASHLVLQIIDDGIGFSSTIQKQGIGLTNMQERANAIMAQLTINSMRNEGTAILMKVKIGSI